MRPLIAETEKIDDDLREKLNSLFVEAHICLRDTNSAPIVGNLIYQHGLGGLVVRCRDCRATAEVVVGKDEEGNSYMNLYGIDDGEDHDQPEALH